MDIDSAAFTSAPPPLRRARSACDRCRWLTPGASTALCFLACLILLADAQASGSRVWTDDQGRTVSAEALSVEEGNVQLLLSNGTVSNFPIERLSQADRDWIEAWKETASSDGPSSLVRQAERGTGLFGEDATGGFTGKWPNSVTVGTSIEVEVVGEDPEKREFIYRSPHFEFRSDAQLRANVVREFARLFEATFAAVEMLPLGLNPKPPGDGHYMTNLFAEMKDYHAAGGLPGSAGVYTSRTNQVLVPLESLGLRKVGSGYTIENRDENHTLIHELTHQLTRQWLGKMPIWLYEGLAEYVASAVYRPGRLTFTNRMASARDYMRDYKGVWNREYRAVAPLAMMDMSHQEWNSAVGQGNNGVRNYATALMMTVYFCHHDDDGSGRKLWEYLQALDQGMDELQAREKFLIRGRSAKELEDEIAGAWRRGRIDLSFDPSTPTSR